jgi:pilus assembly protein CpaC
MKFTQYLGLDSKILFVIFAFLLFIPQTSLPGIKGNVITTLKQHAEVLDFGRPIKRISITNPEIADATVTTISQVLINGKEYGTTNLIIWDDADIYKSYKIVVKGERAEQQISLRIRFAEVNKSALKELGFDFLFKDKKIGNEIVTLGTFPGKVSTPNNPLNIGDNLELLLSSPSQNISTIINALQENKMLKVLAKPNLTAINGEEAKFLAGGEFPIPIVQGGMGVQSVSIQFKEYGIKLSFTPTILDSDYVRLKMETELSSLDFENGITLSGFRVPSLITRRASSTLELQNGRYLVMSGLLSDEIIKSEAKIPLLGHIPLFGKLFSSTKFQHKETELLVLVSPQIIHPMKKSELSKIDKQYFKGPFDEKNFND